MWSTNLEDEFGITATPPQKKPTQQGKHHNETLLSKSTFLRGKATGEDNVPQTDEMPGKGKSYLLKKPKNRGGNVYCSLWVKHFWWTITIQFKVLKGK